MGLYVHIYLHQGFEDSLYKQIHLHAYCNSFAFNENTFLSCESIFIT